MPHQSSLPAEELLDQEIKVLDKGFIRLVDYMGSDQRIVDAARVSYQSGTKTVRSDEQLIRYLLRKKHTTPFEKVRFEFHVKLPIFVARQWMRHRTGCLAGNVMLNFDLPSGKPWKKYAMSVKEVYDKWNTVTQNVTRKDKQGNATFRRDRIKGMRLRSYNEDTGEIYHTHIKDIWSTGNQEVFEVTLRTGTKIQLTRSHQILTHEGWMTLEEARKIDFQLLELKFSSKENTKDMIQHGNHCRLEPTFISVESIKSLGFQDTYDLEVDGPYHNFSANNLIVHNSFNEMSARYSVLEDEFYYPDYLRTQSKTNKQGSGEKSDVSEIFETAIVQTCERDYELYKNMVDSNVARELSRMVLPVNIYTQFYWTVDLWNLMHFMKLRSDSHAQFEIQQYSRVLEDCVNAVAPMSYQAFVDYHRDSVYLSRRELKVVRALVENHLGGSDRPDKRIEGVAKNYAGIQTRTPSGKRTREFKELLEKLDVVPQSTED